MSCTPIIGGDWLVSTALADLQNRLDDANGVHWTTTELQRYMQEGLRTLSAYTQRYRDRGTFSTSASQPFYDLPTLLPSLRAYTVTSQDLVYDIEYALMEPPGLAWTGTEQFNLSLILEALNSRLQQFLLETGAVQTRTTVSETPDADGRIALDPTVMTIRRAAWTANSRTIPLTREDEWGFAHYARTYPQNPAQPVATWPTGYSVGVTPPLSVQLAPAPVSPGSLDLVAVQTGATLDLTAVPLGIPDDWSWVVKFGALAELLSRDGVAFDPTRAAYCEARWQQGITLAKAASVVLNGVIAGNLVTLRSLADLDAYRRNWQTTPGTPTNLALAGQNLIALSVTPDNVYTVTLDLVVNVPLFTLGTLTDCVAVDAPLRDAYLDYCQHLALFKEGPQQVQTAMALFERFQRLCGVTTMVDSASVPNRGPLLQQTSQDVRIKDREAPVEPALP